MKNLKMALIGAILVLANGCAVVSVVSVHGKAKSNHLVGGLSDTHVQLFDPRDSGRPIWYPENFFCQSPWPLGAKVKDIQLIQEGQKTCNYEFDEAGRLVGIANDDHHARFEYGSDATAPEKVVIDGQHLTLTLDGDEGQIEEKIELKNGGTKSVLRKLSKIPGAGGETSKVITIGDQMFAEIRYDKSGMLIQLKTDNGTVDIRKLGDSANTLLMLVTAIDGSTQAWELEVTNGLLMGSRQLPDGEHRKIEYKFDDRGNWIERNDDGGKISTRKITYR